MGERLVFLPEFTKNIVHDVIILWFCGAEVGRFEKCLYICNQLSTPKNEER